MHVDCPSCFAVFDAPQQRLGTARDVRCCFCDHVWSSPLYEAKGDAHSVNEGMYQRFDDVLDGAEPMVADEALMLPEDEPRRESLFAESPAQENEPKRGPVFHIASETPWEGLVRNVPVEKKPLGSKRLWMAAWVGSFLCVIGLGGLAWHEYHSTVQQALHNMQHKA